MGILKVTSIPGNVDAVSLPRSLGENDVRTLLFHLVGDLSNFSLFFSFQLNYYDSINAVISSSNHEPTALVIGTVSTLRCLLLPSVGSPTFRAALTFYTLRENVNPTNRE